MHNLKPGIHLHFDGQCQTAFEAYAERLGGTIELMLQYQDSPAADDVPANWRNKIVHASLRLGDMELAGTDVPPESYEKPAGFHILLQAEDASQGRRVFEALARDGTITMPLQETFWSPCYGTLVDRFGVCWEINSAQ